MPFVAKARARAGYGRVGMSRGGFRLNRADVFGENRKRLPWVPAIKEEHQAHGRECSCADRPLGQLARYHRASGEVEPHATLMGEPLRSRNRHQGISGDRQLHGCAVAPVVALQAQSQAMQGRDLSTLAPLRALRARTPVRAWARRAVGEGVRSCDRVGSIAPTSCPASNQWWEGITNRALRVSRNGNRSREFQPVV